MELVLKGFDDWVIDTAHNDDGKRWVDIFHTDNWFRSFEFLDDALDCLIEDGLKMTEDEICQKQESCY